MIIKMGMLIDMNNEYIEGEDKNLYDKCICCLVLPKSLQAILLFRITLSCPF